MHDGHVPLFTQGHLQQTAAAWHPTRKTHASLRHMRAVGLGRENPDRGDLSVSEGTSVYHILTSTDSSDRHRQGRSIILFNQAPVNK